MIKNKTQLLKATNDEILQFFKTIIFRGSFSISIDPEFQNMFCGQIKDITINGEQNSLCPKYLFVPTKFKQFVKDGACEFSASANLKSLRDEAHSYKLLIKSIKNIIIPEIEHFDKDEESLFRRNLKLKDNLFIGQFTKNRDGSFAIRDIRRSDFSKLILQNGKEQQAIVYHPKITQLEDGKYYEFSWVLNAVRRDEYIYLFKVDETKPFKEINAKTLVEKLNNDIMSYPAGAGQKIVKMLDTLKNQLMASGKEIFIYELLQNANDYPNQRNGYKEMVDVEFHVTLDSLLFLHSGAKFNERNVAAICSINDKEKTDNKETIGYKGIGFKTVFLDNNYVYLQTGDFSFRFDREETRDIVDTPWQILPIWTNYDELTKAEKYIFTNAEDRFRVKFALRPINIMTLRGLGQSYVKMFQDVFKNERVILFIPNLSSVKVYLKGSSTPDIECKCDSNHWQVNDYYEQVKGKITESINADIDKQEDNGSLKIPTKYYDFTQTKVSFACEISGSQLKPTEDTQLYCYLPTKASWGLKFLMNTDMIPTGPRDDIEIDFTDQININAEIAEIAGEKFFDWIKSLCDLSKYTYNSIFNLIPVFDTIIRERSKYKILIERFKKGFDYQIESKEFIPINNHDYALVKDVILDETGLMSSDIMKDEDFFTITGYSGVLPIKVLRSDREFKDFLRRYLDELDSEDNIWNFENLKELCSDSEFKIWVSKQENNNHFLEFLLKQDKLETFIDEEIFIEESSGELCCASNLYYDIDEHLTDLQSFKSLLPHLSLVTREYFKGNEDWNDVISNAFVESDCDNFVNKVLLSSSNIAETKQKLNDKDTSINFFNFLAKNVEYWDKYKSLPFINDCNNVIDNFEDRVIFISSVSGHMVCDSNWMSSIEVEFLSNEYTDITKRYFKDNFGLQDFSDEFIIKNIIVNEDYSDSVSESIDEDFAISKDFIDYCYVHKDFLENGDLRNYSLHVYDGDGTEQWCLAEDHIFFQSNLYDALSSREWLDRDWMYVLDEYYLEGVTDKTEYKKFFSSKFCIDDLTEKKFYVDVVKKNIKNIIKNTSGGADSEGRKNIDFVKYLDDNYNLIFIEKKDGDIFSEFVPVSTNITDLPLDGRVYIYDEELVEIIKMSWFPEDTIYLCSKEYGKSRALLAIGCKEYIFRDFYDEIIVGELDSINEIIDSKEASISFHSFIVDHFGSLTTDQQSKMKNAKVFLYGNTIAARTAVGHKILSVKAKELFDKGLVEFVDLDIIDPDYKTEENSEYWESRLGNTKFTVNHFFSWLKNNITTFSETLQNEELNIEFWGWLKENVSDRLIEDTPLLPILLKDRSIHDGSETVYFSDEYMEGSGIEYSVKRFDKDAFFLSPDYIGANDDIDEWKAFWIKVGVKYEVVDILIDTIIPNLSDIDDESLPKLIADNREALEKSYEGGLIPRLINLRVKAYDGWFYAINETVYVDCEKDEPFPYITLPNQISYHTPEERRLVKNIFDEISSDYISTLSEWQQRKLDCYLMMQLKDSESVREFHYQFIDDLSAIRNTERESLKEIERIERIYLLNYDNKFCDASTLTLGSIYKPFFDFENCNVDTLNYVSNSYNRECSEYTGKLFRALHVHCDFIEDDIGFLTDRECSLYFWGKYLTKKDASITRVRGFISDGLFDGLECIPTKDNMKKAGELYYGSEVSRYIKAIEDWENKVPLRDISEIKLLDGTSIFDELPFKNSLTFLDALYALITITGQDRRTQLLEWMISDYDELYNAKVQEYREDEHALWYNNKNEKVQIKEIYALDYPDKILEQYFGANHRIVNKAYFPAGESFEKACNILGIRIITSDDLKMEPIGDSIFTDRDKDLKLFALTIAGLIDNNDWQSLYIGYCKKLEMLTLHRCTSIMITYNEDESINQSLRKFYHNKDSNDFYFVDSLDGKRVYTLFVKEYTDFLDINEDDITQELVEDIMDSSKNALEIIKGQNTLMLDEAFKDEMEEIIPGIKRELSGNAAEVDDEQGIDVLPSFSTIQDDIEQKYIVEEESRFSYDDAFNNSVGKVHVREHERNYPGCSDASNNNDINPMLSQINIIEDNNVEIDKNTALSIPISTNPQESNMLDDYSQIESDKDYDSEEEIDNENEEVSIDTVPSLHDPDGNDYMGSVDKNEDYQPIGSNPYRSRVRKHPKPFTLDELNRLRSNGSPLELESLPGTEEEIDLLAQCGISPEQIADTNYLAQLRLYMNLTHERDEEPVESMEEFVLNANDVTTHALKGGKYIHSCSAARGVMYISPSVWDRMVDDKWIICVYLDGRGKNFHYINSADEFLKLVEKDDVVIKITGKEKVKVVNELYSGLLKSAKGTAYTLIRVAARTNMDAAFAHYIGAMAEVEDGNEDENDY